MTYNLWNGDSSKILVVNLIESVVNLIEVMVVSRFHVQSQFFI